MRPLTSDGNRGGLNLNFQKFWKDRRLGNSIRADAIADFSSDRRFSRTETDRLQENNRISSRTSDTVSLNYGTSTYIASFQGTFMRTPVKSIITNHNFSYTANDNLSERRALEMSDAGIMRYGGTDDERKKAVHYGGRVIWQDYDLEKISPRAEVSVHYDRNDGLSMIVDTAAMSAQPRNLEGKIKWEKTDVTANLGTDFTVRNDETRIRKISCMYEFGFAADNSEKFSWDLLSEPGKRIEMASGTYSYSQNLFKNSLSARYAADSKDFHLDAGLVASYINQKDNNNMADGRFFKYNWFSVCPEIRVSYKRRLRFDLSTSSEAPSADRLRAVLDYSNPFNLMGGNPSLKQSYTCGTMLGYSTLPTKKGLSFQAGFETMVTANPIVNSVKYFSSDTVLEEYGGYVAPAGAWLMSYSNGNVALKSKLGGGLSSRLLRICTLSANVYYNFSKSPQSQPGSIIDLYTHGPSARLFARIDWNRKISFTANYNFSGMFDYRLREAVSTRIKNNVDVSATWFFYKRNSVNVCYSGAFQNYVSGSGGDVSLHTLSAYVDIPIIPRKLSVRLTASDLLDRSEPFTETVTATYRTSEWKASFGRYYLASIIWNFELNRDGVRFMGE